MSHSTKVMGTKYIAEITFDYDEKALYLQLSIDDVVEEEIKLSNKSLRAVTEGLQEIIRRTNIIVNDFQMDLMAKELYGKLTGDEGLEQHDKDMAEIENKKAMMKDAGFQSSLVSEFRQSFGVKEDDVPKRSQPEINISAPKETIPGQENIGTEMKSMVSEINKRVGQSLSSAPSSEPRSTPTSNLTNPANVVDTTISSVDIEDLINELNETKYALKEDLYRVNKRMEKIDAIIAKISSISRKL